MWEKIWNVFGSKSCIEREKGAKSYEKCVYEFQVLLGRLLVNVKVCLSLKVIHIMASRNRCRRLHFPITKFSMPFFCLFIICVCECFITLNRQLYRINVFDSIWRRCFFFSLFFFYLSRFPKIWLNQKLRSEKKAERFIHVHCGMKHIWSHWTCNCTSFLYHLARMAARCALAI